MEFQRRAAAALRPAAQGEMDQEKQREENEMGKKAAKKIRVKKAAKKRAAVVEQSPAPKAPKPSLRDLKRQVKETWPEAKNLADARRKELAALTEHGDAEHFAEYQDLWKKRSKERHEAWLKGSSKSAQTARAEGKQ